MTRPRCSASTGTKMNRYQQAILYIGATLTGGTAAVAVLGVKMGGGHRVTQPPRLSVTLDHRKTISVRIVEPSRGRICRVRHRNLYPDKTWTYKEGETPNPNLLMAGWVLNRRFSSDNNAELFLENIDGDTTMERFKKDCHWADAATDVTWSESKSPDGELKTEHLRWCEA